MSNPPPDPSQFRWISIIPTLVGGFVSMFGGFVAVILRARTDKKSEISYIKVTVTDSLSELSDIIKNMGETYKASHYVSNKYFNEMKTVHEELIIHKSKLYLIKNEQLRKEVTNFCKDLMEKVEDSKNKVGTLGENPAGNEHDSLIMQFNVLKERAATLSENLRKYNYKVLWIK